MLLISTIRASLLVGSTDICPPWPGQPAKASVELWVQVPQAAWEGLPLWIPQLKEADTLLLMLGKKDQALFGHQVYGFFAQILLFHKAHDGACCSRQ